MQQTPAPPTTSENIRYLKIPYISEAQRRKILKLRNETNLGESYRIIFTNEKSLAWQFREKRPCQPCPPSCPSCSTSSHPNSCFSKNAIYHIQCSSCQSVYIGQTSKCMRNRISEHQKKLDSHVFQHLKSCSSSFIWKILHIEPNYYKRCILEACYIKSFSKNNKLINGCIGRELASYL